MREDYEDSAARHWNDAELLSKQGRMENADQLYGIAAECAIKTALRHPPTHPNAGELARAYRLHVDELWGKARGNVLPRHFPALPLLLKSTNPFHDWSVCQRYHASGSTTAAMVQRHRKMAQRLLAAVRIKAQGGIRNDHV
jgi:hypothetical protein